MDDHERNKLLERLDRSVSTVGARIPDQLTVLGEPVDLREFVFEINRMDAVPPEERERVEETKRKLRRERERRRERIEEGDISYKEGEQLVKDIIGIDRALNGLENLEASDIETDAERRAVADQKRWQSFLKQILGED